MMTREEILYIADDNNNINYKPYKKKNYNNKEQTVLNTMDRS